MTGDSEKTPLRPTNPSDFQTYLASGDGNLPYKWAPRLHHEDGMIRNLHLNARAVSGISRTSGTRCQVDVVEVLREFR
jgi:hypothetical protein